jgi:hypothetical protein
MQKRKKPTKALEKCARAVKDTDELVEHVANIADRYRREHVLDTGSRNSATRKSMRDLQKQAAALTAWLQQAHKPNQATAECAALNKVGVVLYGVPGLAHSESKSVLTWLTQAERAATQCLADTKLLPRKPQSSAPRIAAEALRATFEHHKLKWSATVTKQKQSDAVRLLCAIAKSAGDVEFSPEMARLVLLATNGKAA